LLDNPASMKKLVIKEIETDSKQFGDARRTLIEAAERAVAEQKVIDEPVTVVISQKGWVRARGGHGHDATQFTFKAGDGLYDTFECRTTETLLALGSNGRIYSVPVSALPGARGDGVPITTLVELAGGSRILHYFAGPADTMLLLASTAGYGFSAKAGDMVSRVRAGKSFITLDEGDEPLAPRIINDDAGAIACLSEKGRMLVFDRNEIKAQSGGGRGVIFMDLDPGEKLVAALPINQRGVLVAGIVRGKASDVPLAGAGLSIHFGKRARKGRLLESKIKPPLGLKVPKP
jgi:topoisomerase-4 subunit A